MIDNAAHFAVETIVISCFPMAVGVNHLLRPVLPGHPCKAALCLSDTGRGIM